MERTGESGTHRNGGESAGGGGQDRSTPRVTLIGKPGCHLCEEARAVVAKVTAELGVSWEEWDITQDQELYRRYWEQIPVTLVDGRQHDFWRVDENRLRSALGT